MHTAILRLSRAAQDAVSISSHLLWSFLLREKKMIPHSTDCKCLLRVSPNPCAGTTGTECQVTREEPLVNLALPSASGRATVAAALAGEAHLREAYLVSGHIAEGWVCSLHLRACRNHQACVTGFAACPVLRSIA